MIRDHQQTLTDAAKELRQNQTPAEKIFWDIVRTKQFLSLKFRRQHPIKFYVVDFCCIALKLVIELDGAVHDDPDQAEQDQEREFNLKQWGYTVIRFRNIEILQRLDQTLLRLTTAIAKLKQQNHYPALSRPLPPT